MISMRGGDSHYPYGAARKEGGGEAAWAASVNAVCECSVFFLRSRYQVCDMDGCFKTGIFTLSIFFFEFSFSQTVRYTAVTMVLCKFGMRAVTTNLLT